MGPTPDLQYGEAALLWRLVDDHTGGGEHVQCLISPVATEHCA